MNTYSKATFDQVTIFTLLVLFASFSMATRGVAPSAATSVSDGRSASYAATIKLPPYGSPLLLTAALVGALSHSHGDE